MTSAVASVVANKPTVASPPIADTHSDAALLELGARLEAALSKWREAFDECRRTNKLGKAYDRRGRVFRLENHVRDLQDEIEAVPHVHTFEGVAVKLLCSMWQREFGLDQELELERIAEQVLQAIGKKLPDPIY